MTSRYVERARRNHSRQRGFGSDTFDRLMDCRERRSYRHGTGAPFFLGYGAGERAEIERRSLLDVAAPARS